MTVELKADPEDPPGYRNRARRLAPLLAARALGATIYELDHGESICPYHYEVGNEEWLLVLGGTPTLRHPEGVDVLQPGDLVCFPDGAEGAHQLTNNAADTVRVMMLSTVHEPCLAVYPDSGKVGMWPPGLLFYEADAVDYWDGELPH